MAPGIGEAVFVREGDYWTIHVDQRTLRVRDAKGMRYLAQLLAHPHRDVDVLRLAAGQGADRSSSVAAKAEGLSSGTEHSDPILDDRAREEYRARLADLREEIEEADDYNDPERSARAHEEHDAIVRELTAATGLGGRDRRTGTMNERARLNVTRAIRSAIAHIAEHDSPLGEHLATTVHTGRACVYRPDPDTPACRVVTKPLEPRPTLNFVPPDTRYAHNGELSIAYQVVGDGPVDVVLVNGLIAHLDLIWTNPTSAPLLASISSRARLILFDKPGTGLSDPVAGAPSLEQRMGDITAVMDAAGSRKAVLLGYSEGGMVSAAFAAMCPHRTTGLVLVNSTARSAPGQDYAAAFDQLWWLLDQASARWGEGEFFRALAPSWGDGDVERRTAAIGERACASPGMVRAMVAALRDYDVRPLLDLISCPTLVLHARDEPLLAIELGRELADHIPSARLVELPGVDHLYIAGDWSSFSDEIERFVATEPRVDTRAPRHIALTGVGAIPLDAATAVTGMGARLMADGTAAGFDTAADAVRCARELLDAGLIEAAGVDLDTDGAARLAAEVPGGVVAVSGQVRALLAGSGIVCGRHGSAFIVSDDRAFDARATSSVDHAVAAMTPGPGTSLSAEDRTLVDAVIRLLRPNSL